MPSFYVEDTCALKGDRKIIGVVDRTWRDVDSNPYYEDDDLLQHEKVSKSAQKAFVETGLPPRGHVLVSFTEPYSGCSLVPEDDLVLVDRAFAIGDVVKRSSSDVLSGTIVGTSISCTLDPVNSESIFNDEQRSAVPLTQGPLLDIAGEELKLLEDHHEGDHLIYQDWVGVVTDVFEEVTVRLSNGSVVVVENHDELDVPVAPEGLGALSHGKSLAKRLKQRLQREDSSFENLRPGEVLYPGQKVITKKGNLRRGQWKFGAYDSSIEPIAIVVQVRLLGIEVVWMTPNVVSPNQNPGLEPPRTLDLDVLESGQITWYDLERLPQQPSSRLPGAAQGLDVAAGNYMRFLDPAGAAVKYNGTRDVTARGTFRRIPRRATQGYDMNVFRVRETKTRIDVQWQDLSTSQEEAMSVVPYLNVDDHDVWPGEIVVLKETEEIQRPPGWIETDNDVFEEVAVPKQVGVVQRTDPGERVAHVRWFSDPKVEILGESRSVLMPGSILGQLSTEVEEVSFYEIATYPALTPRRGDLALIVSQSAYVDHSGAVARRSRSNASATSAFQSLTTGYQTLLNYLRRTRGGGTSIEHTSGAPEPSIQSPNNASGESVLLSSTISQVRDIDWFGEIVDLGLDGLLTVRLGALSEVRDIRVPAERVIAIVSGDDASSYEASDSKDEGVWTDESMSIGSQENIYDSDEVMEDIVEYEGGARLDADGGDEMWTTDDEDAKSTSDTSMSDDVAADDLSSSEPSLPQKQQQTDTLVSATPMEMSWNETKPNEISLLSFPSMPAQFQILDTPAPIDHHFLNEAVELSANLMRRIRKEHRIMQSSLPDGTFVRTWDSRLDLLRVLIVGPRNTPYELAPFVMDFHFGSDFPTAPPGSYFHSWTNGIGRINPNLYEEGKICLSLLGTWPGDEKNEGWSAKQSSMLQIIVSLMGLVLVKEPYYNEAGFDVLVGTEESRIPSIHYSERAYVMAKGFIIHALQHPVGGLEDVIIWLYLLPDGPQLLRHVIAESEAVDNGGMLTEGQGPSEGSSSTVMKASSHMTPLSSGALKMLRKHVLMLKGTLHKNLNHSAG
ncbi:Ubiquitin-conjugating enzyme/RWD-like [Lasallia pustulata]|uniref:Ubiquitin-conjugating enzyme/RWD-like n=1 Tax=Lasallia pustulata TaxID=136370 RepID=A0A1W5D4V0_9LECA|nr:Ubiquitin-conjugating enzyme/RWD-like [Lasallia pustulata]